MKQDDELIQRFAATALLPFKEEQLLDDLGGQLMTSRPGQSPALDLGFLSQFDNIAPFIMLLEESLAKFEFGKHSFEEWRSKYVFPRESSLRRYRRRQFGNGEDPAPVQRNHIINQSPEHVAQWVRQVVIRNILAERRSGRDPVIIMAGGTGAGKSTLNKYITTVHFGDFVSNRIVSTRIEYRKLYSHLERRGVFAPPATPGEASAGIERRLEAEIRRKAQKYIICCCVRDLLHSSYTRVELQADGHTRLKPADQISPLGVDLWDKDIEADFRAFIEDQYADRCGANADEVIACVMRSAADFKSQDVRRRSSWFSRATNLGVETKEFMALELYLYFCVSRGVRIFQIFDGFDYIQAADFLQSTTHALVLRTLANWIVRDEGRLHLPRTKEGFKSIVQITMRNSTIEHFWKDHSLAFGQFPTLEYYVSPPELRDIYNAVTRRVVEERPEYANWEPEDARRLFWSVQTALAAVAGVPRHRVSSLFLENTRHRMNYIRHVLEAALRDAVELVPDLHGLKPHELSRLLWEALDQITHRKNYRLIEVLLQSKNDRFANFIRIDRINRWPSQVGQKSDANFISESILQDNNIRSGYVGNIFNYHIPYTEFADISFFLEKIRILEILRLKPQRTQDHDPLEFSQTRLSKEQILSAFTRKGWQPSRYFDISIAILIREALIDGIFAESGGLYEITSLGKTLVTRMIGQMRYLENVYFGCLIPGALALDSIDIVRSRAKRLDWVAAAIFHVWILLRLIRTAEGDASPFAFERARKGVAEAVKHIVMSEGQSRALGGQLSSRVLGLMRRLDERLGVAA